MCLIVLKKKGVQLDARFLFKSLKQSAVKNNSGCGFAIKRDNKIILSKGQNSVDDLIEEIKKAGIRKSDELLIHLRNPSPQTGKEQSKLCHPFVVTSNEEELERKRYFGSKPVFAHNGRIDTDILYNHLDVYQTSDTYLFVKHVLSAPHFVDIMHLLYRNKNTTRIYKRLFGDNNKFVLLRPKYSASIFGTFLEEKDLFFSNDTYKIPERPTVSTVRSLRGVTFNNMTGKFDPHKGSEEETYLARHGMD